MDRSCATNLSRIAAAAFITGLMGCAPRSPDPVITDATRQRLAETLQASGDSANAAVVRDQTISKAGHGSDPLTHATALVVTGQVDQGMLEAKAALAARADDPPFALEVGRLAIRAGRLADAADVYRQILLRHPDSVEALNGKGVVLAQQGDLTSAAETFRSALALHPQDAPTRNNLALVMTLSGRAGSALPILEDLDRSETSPHVKANLALAREKSQAETSAQSVLAAGKPASP